MREEDIARLREHWLFANVPELLLAPLIASSRVVRFLPGEEIFAEGDDPDGLYLIIQGTVRIAARGPGNNAVLATLGPNEIFGEMGVLDGEPRSGRAAAMTICTLFFIPAEPFLDLLERSSLVCNRLLVLLAQRLRNTNARLAELPAAQPANVEATEGA